MEWAGVAVFKKTYQLFRQRGYRIRLLSAAFRNHMHWSEFIGGDVVISPPYSWQVRFNASDIEVRNRIDDPVDPKIVDELSGSLPISGARARKVASRSKNSIRSVQLAALCVNLSRLATIWTGWCETFLIPNPMQQELASVPSQISGCSAFDFR